MLQVVINGCHGGFGLSPEAILWLYEKQSELVQTSTFEEYAGKDQEYIYRKLLDESVYLTGDLFHAQYGTVLVNKKKREVYYLSTAVWSDEHAAMCFRSHPDLIAVVQALGDKANGQCARLKIVTIHDPDITVETAVISEYDGSEWISERHRNWYGD